MLESDVAVAGSCSFDWTPRLGTPYAAGEALKSKKKKKKEKKYRHPYVHSSAIHSSQDIETV